MGKGQEILKSFNKKAECIRLLLKPIPAGAEKRFPSEDIEAGIQVEYEHTKDKAMAKKIALAHLLEDKSYYKKLNTLGL